MNKKQKITGQKQPIILAVESSCDETSAALIHDGKILSNIINTQTVHKNYGGVVPELASRAHQQNIVPVVTEALTTANIKKTQLNAVAFTSGPGLLGSLMVGSSFSKSLAWSLNIPLIRVNHMHAHVLSHFITPPYPQFPYLCLTVSGGHTQIVRVDNPMSLKIMGETLDDAAGEAFDKAASLLNFPYPGGPYIDQYAQSGNPHAFHFPLTEMQGYNYSFSGIKTAFLYFLREKEQEDKDFIAKNIHDICASIQHAIIKMLLNKLEAAAKYTGIREIAIAGGVAANKGLRNALGDMAVKNNWNLFIPDFQYCTDNAAMIAVTANYHYYYHHFASLSEGPEPRQKLIN